ncbi:MAG: hypothetical protein KKF30_18300 [Proteobacteria bacterium]|nr:hypothetical protein [Pseudomonadota bacterium]MBU4469801.1 hypothetical protein [Pseudomonadota bacterium]MCG2753036.1 hypothetical protein [Desulfobacteraceae bacterium]
MKKILCSFFILLLPLIACSDVRSENGAYKEIFSVRDYQYEKNRYFLAGDYYVERFESGLSNDLLSFTLDAWMQVLELDVWVSSPDADSETLRGIAAVDPGKYKPSDFDTLKVNKSDEPVVYKGWFKRLSPDQYGFDGDRGYFWLNASADDDTVIAISCLLKDKSKVGTHERESTLETVVLRLIKPKNQQPTEAFRATWPLMMKNVYYLGDNLAPTKNLNLLVKSIQHEEGTDAATGGKRNNLLHEMGLDVIDECRYLIRNGDGLVDFNSFNINVKTGILIFPSLQPFNPPSDSRFELDEKNRADIYNAVLTEDLEKKSKFQLIAIDELETPDETTAMKSIKGKGKS